MKSRDKDGNTLSLTEDGVFLLLKKERQYRLILKIENGKIVKYVKKKNVMRTNPPMIGFNYESLKMIKRHPRIKDKNIYIIIGKKAYFVSVEDVINHKEFLHFKKDGFELQCFYPVELLTDYNPKERNSNIAKGSTVENHNLFTDLF